MLAAHLSVPALRIEDSVRGQNCVLRAESWIARTADGSTLHHGRLDPAPRAARRDWGRASGEHRGPQRYGDDDADRDDAAAQRLPQRPSLLGGEDEHGAEKGASDETAEVALPGDEPGTEHRDRHV